MLTVEMAMESEIRPGPPGTNAGAGNPKSNVSWHEPVLVKQALDYLKPRPGEVFADCTLGTGGHSLALLPRILPHGRLIALDRDREALELARRRLSEFSPQVEFVHENVRNLAVILKRLHIQGLDGLLVDLGISSLQLDSGERGFSFASEGPLDMRMDRTQELTAEILVNTLSVEELADLIKGFGEERFARRIAKRIVEIRRRDRITMTKALARLIAGALPPSARHGRLHAATRTFQALRIAVNDELGSLQDLLGSLPDTLSPGGRVVVIAYHSLEDRLVKKALVQGARDGIWALLNKKPMRPLSDETARNPRARSAKLRAAERLPLT